MPDLSTLLNNIPALFPLTFAAIWFYLCAGVLVVVARIVLLANRRCEKSGNRQGQRRTQSFTPQRPFHPPREVSGVGSRPRGYTTRNRFDHQWSAVPVCPPWPTSVDDALV